jgi:hypothetical protein
MLGRKVAVVVTMLVLAIGGGSALAATHGNSHSAKPKVHKVVRVHKAAPAVVVTGHHCHDSGANISASSL